MTLARDSQQQKSSESSPSGYHAVDRRRFMQHVGGGLAAASMLAGTASAAGTTRDYSESGAPVRYPEPDVVVLDPRFDKIKIGNTPIQRIYHHPDMLWAEGPAWNGVGRYLLWSDIPNNVQLRWLEEDSHVSRFRFPAGNSNGNTFDFQGRQIACEHLTRRVVRYEYDGTVSVLADQFGGKPFNAPNDAVVHPNTGDIWFTDPGYGGLMHYEGKRETNGSLQPNQKEAVYRIDSKTGQIHKVTDEIFKPNGLCFSPDYKKLYVADTGSSHYPEATKEIRVWDLVDESKLTKGRRFISMELDLKRPDGSTEKVAGMADGIRADTQGNIWASAGWVGDGYDGVHVFSSDGVRIGQILLPEICSNVCFGGTKRNRLFMTASTSVYAVYVEAQGAHIS